MTTTPLAPPPVWIPPYAPDGDAPERVHTPRFRWRRSTAELVRLLDYCELWGQQRRMACREG